MTQEYYFEMTDTFGGEANYCWLYKYKITAKTLHGGAERYEVTNNYKRFKCAEME